MCFLEDSEPNTVLSAADERSVFCATCNLRINKIIVFKLFAEVQLMVPSYGFCPEPPECEEEVLESVLTQLRSGRRIPTITATEDVRAAGERLSGCPTGAALIFSWA